MQKQYAVSMEHITKRFPGVVALDDVSFNVCPGEIHALIGENGAGKSTLMKVLGGVHMPDTGVICIGGEQVTITSPIDSINKKISVIYQEFNLVPTLSVRENIFLGRELRTKFRTMDRKTMGIKAQEIMGSLGFSFIDCEMPVEQLSIAQQQIVEIAKALFNDSNVVVMDEPTAVLTEKESEILFQTIQRLRDQGVAIVYISHRLEEIIRLSDRITVLRDGKFITELDNSAHDTPKDVLVRHMVGRELNQYYPERRINTYTRNILTVENLTKNGMFRDISFSLNQGEIIGFFGLVGAGRTELMKAIFGEFVADSGSIAIDGRKTLFKNPSMAIQNGLALVPEDRKGEGLVLIASMAENIALPNSSLVSRNGYVYQKEKENLAQQYIDSLSIRPALCERPAQDFSGGNQQKIVVAKWLAAKPKVIILDEPTRGVDIYAKKEIYEIIKDMALSGIGVIVVSSDMPEVLGICDRILVMHEGKLMHDYHYTEATQENIMASASGIK